MLLLTALLVLVLIANTLSIPIKIPPLPSDSGTSNNVGESSGSSSSNNEGSSDNGNNGGSSDNDNNSGSSDNVNNGGSSDKSDNVNNGGSSDNGNNGGSFTISPTMAPFTISPTVQAPNTISPTYFAGSPTPKPSTVPTYLADSPTPKPSNAPSYVAGSPTPIPTSSSGFRQSSGPTESPIDVDDNKQESDITNNILSKICNRDDTKWLNLYLSSQYKRWLVSLIVFWVIIFIYAVYKIYMIYSLQEVKYGSMTLNFNRYGFIGFAAIMRFVELLILTTLKNSSATCVEFSFNKSNPDFNYNSSLVPYIVLTHELFYPVLLIVIILRQKLIWIQFKRIFNSHVTKNVTTLSIENYGILIGVIFILMDIISFAGPIRDINSYAIATQIICPILSVANQLYKCYSFNSFDVSSQAEQSKFGWPLTANDFDRIIAVDLIIFAIFAIITTRTFLFNYPLASMLTYSIIMRVLELLSAILLSFNAIGVAAISISQENIPNRISNSDDNIDDDDDDSCVSIFVNDNLHSEIDTSPKTSSKRSLISSKSHRAISYSPQIEMSGSTKISKKSNVSKKSSKSSRSNYSALYSNSLMQSSNSHDSHNSDKSIRL